MDVLRKNQFDPLETICSNGSYELAKFLREKGGQTYDVGKHSFADNESCLHLAVANGRADMVEYLIKEHPSQLSQATTSLNETPNFFLLSKLKDEP